MWTTINVNKQQYEWAKKHFGGRVFLRVDEHGNCFIKGAKDVLEHVIKIVK